MAQFEFNVWLSNYVLDPIESFSKLLSTFFSELGICFKAAFKNFLFPDVAKRTI